MPAYVIAVIDIKDPVKYEGYGEAWNVQSFAEDYGGEFVMVSNAPDVEVIEGEWTSRIVVMKFPDAEKARAWYHSPKYHDVRPLRWASSDTNMILVPGFDMAALTAPAVAAG